MHINIEKKKLKLGGKLSDTGKGIRSNKEQW